MNLPVVNILQGCGSHTDTIYSRWRDLSVCGQTCLAKAIVNTNNKEQGTHTCICCARYNKTAEWALSDPGRGAVLAAPNWSLAAHFDLAGVWVTKVRYWPGRSAYAAWLSIYDLASLNMDQLTVRFINVAIAIAQVGFALGRKKSSMTVPFDSEQIGMTSSPTTS